MQSCMSRKHEHSNHQPSRYQTSVHVTATSVIAACRASDSPDATWHTWDCRSCAGSWTALIVLPAAAFGTVVSSECPLQGQASEQEQLAFFATLTGLVEEMSTGEGSNTQYVPPSNSHDWQLTLRRGLLHATKHCRAGSRQHSLAQMHSC